MGVELIKLPLWKNALEEMRKKGLAYGQSWPAEFFERHLKVARDNIQYGLGISFIREELEADGFYLSGRGQKGNQFVILPPSSNADVMKSYQRHAARSLARGVILGTNTSLETLTDAERKKHENTLRKMATKAVLMQRSGAVAKILEKQAPALLLK